MTLPRQTQHLFVLVALAACVGGCAGRSVWNPQGCNCPYGSQPYAAQGPAVQMPGVVVPGTAGQPTVPSTIPGVSRQVQKPAGASTQSEGDGLVVRGQSPAPSAPNANDLWRDYTPGSDDYRRSPTPVSGGVPASTPATPPYSVAQQPAAAAPAYGQPYQYPYGGTATQQPVVTQGPGANGVYAAPPTYAQPQTTFQPGTTTTPVLPPPPTTAGPSGNVFAPPYPGWNPPSIVPGADPSALGTPAPLDVFVEETRTGRLMFGVAVNSDAGVTGQITVDERNFDITRVPTSWDDVMSGNAFRGAGQGFRMEAQPGSQVQRYLISFTEPYFLGSNISMNASAFYFDRNYFDWDESRYGGRLAFGYRLTPDLSVAGALRAENVTVFNPRVNTVPELNESLGKNDLFSGRISMTHDTRDLPFAPTEGHLIELSYEQAFGSFDYPRGEVDFAQYWMLRERPDGSGRHVLAYNSKLGFSGADTPIFENYFAGGFSTLRGFAFRGASPVESTVRVGGEFRWINSLEYIFPLTADDMLRGVVFCDFGTVERDIALRTENFRVAPGFGLRVNVPALGPAPLAFDFAFPVAMADTDDKQIFSFFFGATRQ